MARAYRARRMIKVPNCKGQTGATSLGPETHQSTTRPMTTCPTTTRLVVVGHMTYNNHDMIH